MSSRQWDTAEKVADALNRGVFSLPFSAVAEAAPKHRLEDLAAVKVSVVPIGPVTSTRDDRQVSEREFPVNVIVYRQCSRDDSARFAELMGLLEEIQDFLEDTKIDFDGILHDPIEGTETEHDPQLLNDPGLFLGVVSVSYRGWRTPD